MVPLAKIGDWCPCGDIQALNSAAEPGRYPLRNIHDQIRQDVPPAFRCSKMMYQNHKHNTPRCV